MRPSRPNWTSLIRLQSRLGKPTGLDPEPNMWATLALVLGTLDGVHTGCTPRITYLARQATSDATPALVHRRVTLHG